MDRREFLRQVALWSAGLSVGIPCLRIGEARAAADVPPLVSHATGREYGALVERVLAPLGGMGSFVRPDERVVVKPNIGWDRGPELGANTHPLVVRALVEQALAAGAGQVLVFDRTCNEERRCYVNSGIQAALAAIKDRRLKLFHPDSRKYVPVEIRRGRAVKRLEVYRDALEADCYINVPVAKHHGLSRLTLGLKNSMGVLGGSRGAMHHNLGQKLADLATVIQPRLTVIDATRILLANGPQGGDPADVKVLDTLIASADPVAADAYATTLFGLRPEEIASTVAAHAAGLGEMDLARVRIVPA